MTARLAKANRRYLKAVEALRAATVRWFPLGCELETEIRRGVAIRGKVIGYGAPAVVVVQNVITSKVRRVDVRGGNTRMVKRAPKAGAR